MKCIKLKFFLAEKYPKISVFTKKSRQIYRYKYFKVPVIHFLMASITNLFGVAQIEAYSGVDPTLIFKEINKDLEEYLLEKKY